MVRSMANPQTILHQTGEHTPLCSIIFPAHNEEVWLRKSLSAAQLALKENHLHGELIVTDNASTDRTREVALSCGATVVEESIRQISRSRNKGASVARGKWLIFVDADTLIEPELVRKTIELLESGTVCGGGAGVVFDHPTGWLATRVLDLWRWMSKTFRLAAGSYVFARADLHREIEGFSTKVYAGEEVFYARALKKAGKKRGMRFVVIEEPPVITSGRKVTRGSTWRLLFSFLLVVLLPFSVRYRSLCPFWYDNRYRNEA